ncbi:MAG: hypothetical protein ABSF26_23020 [Thermoguttaceae bacterium]
MAPEFPRPGATVCAADEVPARPAYHSPLAMAFSPDGRILAVADHTASLLVRLDAQTGKLIGQTEVSGQPAGVAWSPDGSTAYVTLYRANHIAELDSSGNLRRTLPGGGWPVGAATAAKRGWLLAADYASNSVSIVQCPAGRPIARLPVARMPYFLAVSPDEKLAVVGNRLPAGDASQPSVSAVVGLLDLDALVPLADVPLPPNSTNVHGVAISPDGHWAYMVHTLGHTAIPTTQIEYGWISANALSVIDLATKKRYATVLLDQPEHGAADPWGLALSRDGATAWIALAGAQQVARVDLEKLHRLLPPLLPEVAQIAAPPEQRSDGTEGPTSRFVTGQRVTAADDPTAVELVVGDRPAAYGMGLYLPGIVRRIDLPGKGPRGLALSPDGRQLAVAMYFAGTVVWIDAKTLSVGKVTHLDDVEERGSEADARRGESIFHDATYCRQQWLSCATCHPDARVDGLNWDLMNDGAGNPKNTRSLVVSHRLRPAMWRGVRPDMESAVAAGFEHILFRAAPAADLRAVAAYLRTLRPEPSPRLVDGQLSPQARQGQAVFQDPQTGCARCHRGPLLTDSTLHDVGTHAETDWPEENQFYTPSLLEAWRTAPYLHHGKVRSLREVVTKFNPHDRHGKTSHLSAAELSALVEYLESL